MPNDRESAGIDSITATALFRKEISADVSAVS